LTRIVVANAALVAITLLALALVTAIRAATNLAIPGWASYVTGILGLILLQSVSFVTSLIFLALGARQQAVVIPRRDYSHYVAGVSELTTAPGA